MRFHTLADWLAWQEQLHPSTIELGLERVKSVACKMPFFNVSPKIKTIIVGGTNGKGSCVAFLETILIEAGYRVGAYSSPHLLRYNERIRINGLQVSDETLCDAFDRVDSARAGISLTYFEFGTLAALDIFYHEKVDVQVLEVGMGGRLDAVNIMEPDAAVVTNVALDHQDWLGHTREAIGREKAGIFRAGIPLIIGEPDPPVSLLEAAHQLATDGVLLAGRDFSCVVKGHDDLVFQGKTAAGQSLVWRDLPVPSLPLPSAACALQVLAVLGLAGQQVVSRGLRLAGLQGRMQQLEYAGRHIILDVAHNPAGASFLAGWLQAHHFHRLHVVFSALADKDHAGLVEVIAPHASHWYLAALDTDRAERLEKLSESVARVRGHEQGFDTIGAALQAALAGAGRGGTVLVYGSFYTVAAVLNILVQGAISVGAVSAGNHESGT